ncbi:hypothetical protein FHH53_21495 [Salmonella enterica]|nr:hypothetical protein [Salmonella enterica]EBD1273563.1 hypothetical protein [Salmonella enterica]EBO3805968.1 hypothetical protein [Salmonella enterica]ECJ5078921.1 hypothetical protein [Salmonella enterica subsp. enterica]EFR1850478.1 hypothetical protein [Salmonella enterica]
MGSCAAPSAKGDDKFITTDYLQQCPAEYSDPPWHKDYFRERQYQFTRLGINAVILAVRLRKATGMPETRLTGHDEWSAVSVFRKVWRRERALRAAEATRNREWNQLVIPDGMSNQ